MPFIFSDRLFVLRNSPEDCQLQRALERSPIWVRLALWLRPAVSRNRLWVFGDRFCGAGIQRSVRSLYGGAKGLAVRVWLRLRLRPAIHGNSFLLGRSVPEDG